MAEFEWHAMADERPENLDARYLLLGNGGGLYVGKISTPRCFNGMMSFHIPNHRDGYMTSDMIKAWAEIPEYRESKWKILCKTSLTALNVIQKLSRRQCRSSST